MNATTTKPQMRLSQCSPNYMRVTFDNPPLNLMGPQFVLDIRQVRTHSKPASLRWPATSAVGLDWLLGSIVSKIKEVKAT